MNQQVLHAMEILDAILIPIKHKFLGEMMGIIKLMLGFSLHLVLHLIVGLLVSMVQKRKVKCLISGYIHQLMLENKFAIHLKHYTMHRQLISLESLLPKLLIALYVNQELFPYHNNKWLTSMLFLHLLQKLQLLVLFHSYHSLMMHSIQDH